MPRRNAPRETQLPRRRMATGRLPSTRRCAPRSGSTRSPSATRPARSPSRARSSSTKTASRTCWRRSPVGSSLCAIASREAAAIVGEHIEGRKDLELAEKNAAMTQDLFEHEAASRMALQQAQNDLAKARARVARTEEALRMLGLVGHDELPPVDAVRGRVPIVSPIAGVVIERKVTEGQFVQSDSTPILTVGNLDTVWVIGDLFERDLRLVSVGQTASITTAAYPGDRFQGRVNYISPAIDPATRTAKVRVSVDNPRGRLKPEMFAAIDLHVDAHERALTVPTAAIFTETGSSRSEEHTS